MKKRSVGIIGGGAAGMMAAVTAAGQGAEVTLFEQNDRVGKKLLMTGNGRCNLGNRELSAGMYCGADPAWIGGRLKAFGTDDTIRFFRGIGLMIKEKNGYLYPVSEQASAVLDVLRFALKSAGVRVETDCRIDQIQRQGDGRIGLYCGRTRHLFDRAVIACGGRAAPKTGSDGNGFSLARQLGHSVVPTVPALVQLRCGEEFFRSVAGVRAQARLTVRQGGAVLLDEQGELQITDYGISGIPVFQMSRKVGYLLKTQPQVKVHIGFLPDLGREDLEPFLEERLARMGDRTVEEFFTGLLHKKLMQLFVRTAGLKGNQPVAGTDRGALRGVLEQCLDWEVTVTGTNGYDQAQVSAGGVSCGEVTEDLESRLAPGVYFAGEILDVDGRCGGYNLQWAWSSGYLAGTAAAGGKRASQRRGAFPSGSGLRDTPEESV